MHVDQISTLLLTWYDRHARTLPWRQPPGSGRHVDPYRVWLSEIMLQQTTVAAVSPYFQRFLDRWPTVDALARADDSDVMAAWAGLGYYARARNMLACARRVSHELDGCFPDEVAALRALPGIGDYTAAAIAAIAFDRQATVIDGNVERVVARLFALEEPLPQAKTAIRAHATPLTPAERPGDFAQAMMDLGATICTPRRPACSLCPLMAHCAGRARGIAEDLPRRQPKAARPLRRGLAFWLVCERHVLTVQRPAKGLFGNMRALPVSPWAASMSDSEALGHAPSALGWRILPQRVRHVFTHFELDLGVAVTHCRNRPMGIAGDWLAHDRITQAGFPSLFQKIASLAYDEIPIFPENA